MFTHDDAVTQLDQVETLLAKTRMSLEAKRYVEANGYYEAALEELGGDVFGSLAAGEIHSLYPLPSVPSINS